MVKRIAEWVDAMDEDTKHWATVAMSIGAIVLALASVLL